MVFPMPTPPIICSSNHSIQPNTKKIKKMEVELGLKLTKSLDEFASADLRIAKDRSGPLFISTETDIMFLLTAHLKGYRREQIKIEINEDGRRIIISGERPVQEMMVGWKVYKKEREMRGFRKAFKIPSGVILDKIKSRFNDDESVLVIFMRKVIKGIRGVGIEEVKEEEIARGNSESLQVEADEKIVGETSEREVFAEPEAKGEQKDAENLPEGKEKNGKEKIDKEVEEDEGVKHIKGLDGNVAGQKEEPTRTSAEKAPVAQEYMPHDAIPRVENEMMGKGLGETSCSDSNQESDEASKRDQKEKEQEVQERFGEESSPETEEEKQLRDQSTQTDAPIKSNKKFCAPVVAGSALLVSLIVFVMHLIRTNNKPSNKKH